MVKLCVVRRPESPGGYRSLIVFWSRAENSYGRTWSSGLRAGLCKARILQNRSWFVDTYRFVRKALVVGCPGVKYIYLVDPGPLNPEKSCAVGLLCKINDN